MKKWNVYVTRMLPQSAIDLLKQECNVEVNPKDRVLSKAELLKEVQGRDAILCLLTDTIDADVIAAASKAKIFANYAVGFDNIDLKAAAEKGVYVTNTPGVLTETTADLAWALLFAVARRVVEADTYTRDCKFKGWGPLLFLGQDVTGKTLGIIGTGRIGSSFGRKAKGFEMKIIYHDVKRNEEFEREVGAIYVDKTTLLKEADFVSLHVPLLPSTTHLIGKNEFSLMKKTAILINTSRGPVVDEKALVEALNEGVIWGAGLDVYEDEPRLSEGLMQAKNAVILPHIASASIETRTKMALLAVNNILAAKRGEVPPNCVNR